MAPKLMFIDQQSKMRKMVFEKIYRVSKSVPTYLLLYRASQKK